MKILSADKLQLLKVSKGEEYANLFSTLLDCMDRLGLEEPLSKVDGIVLQKVQESLMDKFGQLIPSKMAESGMLVDCTVVDKGNQAEFFFDTLESVE